MRALEMEQCGFLDGAVAQARSLYAAVEIESDPCLAIAVRYFLASYLMLTGNLDEAREITEEGIILAWEHEAREELVLFDNLSRQLCDAPRRS